MVEIQHHGGRAGLHDFPRADKIDRTLGVAARDLERPRHKLFDIGRDANLIVIAHIAAHDAALVVNILDPLDEFIAAPDKLAFLGQGGGAGKYEYGNSALRRVVDGACQRLGAAFHMNQDGLRPTGCRGKTMRGTHADHFVRTGDHLGQGLTRRPRGR
jgi:hypothetical protein